MNLVLFYMLLFSDYQIGILSVADWALIILLIRGMVYRPRIQITKRALFGLVLMLASAVISMMINITKPYFEINEFIQSFGKLLIYILSIYIVPKYLIEVKIDFIKHLKCFFIVAILGGAVQRMIVLILGKESWPLYSLGSHWFGLTTEATMFNNAGMMRSRSFWSEPAHFAIAISMIFILLLFMEKKNLKKIYYIIYIAGIILANSISGYGIMVAILFIYLMDFRDKSKVIKVFSSGMAFILAIIILLIVNDYLRGRVINLFNMKDHSGIVRTVGGFFILEYIPWVGVGIGNHANFYHSLKNLNSMWFSGSGEFYNNILLAVITMGYTGALGFILFQYELLKKHKKIFLALMVTHFGWGKLFTAPLWVFLILYLILLNEKSKNNYVGGNK